MTPHRKTTHPAIIAIGAGSGRYATQKEAIITAINHVMHAEPRDFRIFRSAYPVRKTITRARIRIAHSRIVVSLTSSPLLKQRSRHCWVALDNSAKAKPENYRQDYHAFRHFILATSSSRLRAKNRLTWASISEDVRPNYVTAMAVRLYEKGGQNKVSDPAQITPQRLM
jgi:hypothetical protein